MNIVNNWVDSLHLLNRVLEISPLLPLVAGWLRKSALPTRFILVFYYVVSEAILYIISVISRAVFRNDIYVFHVSTVLAVLLLSQTYKRLSHSKILIKNINTSLLIFFPIAIADAFLWSGLFSDVNSYSHALGSVILLAIALLHIIKISRTSLNLESQPDFFFSISVLIYFSYTIVTYVATNIIYNSGYDLTTTIRLDDIMSSPDTLLYAIHMGLLAWMFSFFPLSIHPRRALPRWLHYSRWQPRPYKLLGQPITFLHHSTTAAS